MVLAGLGHVMTEGETQLRCDHTVLGIRLNRIAEGLADLPVFVKYEDAGSLDDLRDIVRSGTTPVVGIDLRQVEGIFAFHAVVVLNIDAERVTAHDPLYKEGSRSIGLRTFEAAWNEAGHESITILPDVIRLAI